MGADLRHTWRSAWAWATAGPAGRHAMCGRLFAGDVKIYRLAPDLGVRMPRESSQFLRNEMLVSTAQLLASHAKTGESAVAG